MTARGLCMLGLAVAACAPPTEAEPCAPGSPLVMLDEPLTIGPDPVRYPILQCTGRVGCEGEPDFRWARGGGGSYFYCGCDGTTRNTDLDFGGPPDLPLALVRQL